MIKLLQLIFLGHVHKWKILRHTGLGYRDEKGVIVANGQRIVLQCEACGNVKQKDIL